MTQGPQTEQRSGLLVRDAGGFALRCDSGAIIRLLLHRVPVDLVEKRVKVTGVWISDDLIEVEGVMSD
ncbi:DUF5818 domain-containing protein [Sphingobium subterraneum]|uniref:Uncharacterized protein n=1 Tax=Sphingobium subterraneum TaxID=627688 RepID=A0A841J5R9_9SPHN|nr:DUF5818 domain-containing protein [Sphingobium subterraneum]MBB6124866.1 hypothetical protein [Sphingobium subterraneum]